MLENTGLVLEGGGMAWCIYGRDIRILYGTRFIFSICNRCISWCFVMQRRIFPDKEIEIKQ